MGNEHGPMIASSQLLGTNNKVNAKMQAMREANLDPWIGFNLKFPLGKEQESNEDKGFGVRHCGKSFLITLIVYNGAYNEYS